MNEILYTNILVLISGKYIALEKAYRSTLIEIEY